MIATMNVGGVDGCPVGWVLAKFAEGDFFLDVYPDISTLISENQILDRILIDMPIGLSSPGFNRTIEGTLRKELKGRSSTVFNPPCRAAVYESEDDNARLLNKQIEGKSLSIQSLNIRKKIKEIDEFLLKGNPSIELIESHPELCFKHLKGEILFSKKSKADGISERISIIKKYEPRLIDLYETGLNTIQRKQAKKDDLLDAICLCLVNKLSYPNKLNFLKDINHIDQKGIKIQVGFY